MILPEAFVKRMKARLGPKDYMLFEEALSLPAPVSLRINTSKFGVELPFEKVPWCGHAFYLPIRPVFGSDPLWHAGGYYVQEAGSMMLEKVFLKARSLSAGPLAVLDLCAAPGGKSTHLASLMDGQDLLVSNEVIRSRVPVLYENIVKHGRPNVIVTSADSREFMTSGEAFDIILVDAPCSGEGLFRKDPAAIAEWNEENVNTCELRQNRILGNIAGCLKPGGFLIYCTCTYNPGENSEQVDQLIRKGFEPVAFDMNGHSGHEFQCYPHEIKGEGFYIALLRKNYSEDTGPARPKQGKLQPIRRTGAFESFIKTKSGFYEFEGLALAVPEHVFEFYNTFLTNIYCYAIGTKVCSISDKVLAPSEFLPFSVIFNRDVFPDHALTHEQALSYLSNQALPNSIPGKGHVTLSFGNVPLGLGKLAGNRINNLYPNAWRLRKQIDKAQWFTLMADA